MNYGNYSGSGGGSSSSGSSSPSFWRDWGSNPFSMGDVGTVMNAMGDFAQAMNQNKSLRFQAHQLENKAKTTRAIGTRQMQGMREKKRQVISNMTAQMAGGGSANDSNMVKMKAKVASKLDTNMYMAEWMANTQANSEELQAKALRREAKIAKGVGLGKVVNSVLGMFGG